MNFSVSVGRVCRGAIHRVHKAMEHKAKKKISNIEQGIMNNEV
jgi:hypothetical protein